MLKVIVLTVNEDGPSIAELTENEFQRRLTNGEYGQPPEFDTELPGDLEQYVGTVVIRGKVIVPEPVTTVTKYKLPL